MDIPLRDMAKVNPNSEYKNLLKNSKLPFAHYYYYGNINDPKIINLPQYNWIIEEVDLVRQELQDN